MSQQQELPSGWVKTSIGDVSIKGGQRKPGPDEGFVYVDIGSIDREKKCISSPQYLKGSDAPSRARKEIYEGDILVSLTRPNLNAVALVDEKYSGQIASTGFEIIRPNGVDSRYIFALTRSRNFINEISGQVQGALYPAAKSVDVKAYEFPLPPLAEQIRIANKLDELLAQVDTIKARVDAIPDILKRFRQSVLAAAVSGRLTEEWRKENGDVGRGENLAETVLQLREERWSGTGKYKEASTVEVNPFGTLPDSWTLISLDSVIDANRPICYGILMPKENLPDGVLYVKVRDMRGEVIDVAGLQRTSHEIASKYERSSLLEGDLLVAIRGTYGRIVEVPKELEGGNITQDSARVAVCDSISSRYVMHLLRSIPLQKYFQSVARGVAVKGVNIGDLRPAPVSLPPYTEQVEIVREIDALFAFADIVEREVIEGQIRVDSLVQSILAKAFRGELVQQNPDDETARVLLERIRDE